MSNFTEKVRTHLPNHYLDDYPRFVMFLEKYYEWLYRQGGFTSEEKAILLAKRDWLQTNIDRFMESGEITDIASTEAEVEEAIHILSERKNPGAVSSNMIKDFTLERTFSPFLTSDGEQFVTADGNHLESKDLRQDVVKMWVESQGFFTPESGTEYGRMDEIMLVRMVKHINQVKGTQKAAELFFNMFFDEDISLNNGGNGAFFKPKSNIFTIDDIASLIDDKNSVIRDDDYYNEFSYVIKVKNPPAFYKLAFEAVYLKFLHPAGFKVFLQQADPNEIVRQRHEFLRASQATYIDSSGVMNLVGFDVPRFENNELILEEAASNLLTKSIDMDSINGWTIGTHTQRLGKTNSPFGSPNATLYTTDTNMVQMLQVASVESETIYYLSYYAKMVTGTDTLGLITDKWQRYSVELYSGSIDTIAAGLQFFIPVGSVVALACAQLEKTKVTSYIPTFNSSAARAADIVVDEVS